MARPPTEPPSPDMFAANAQRMQVVMSRLNVLLHTGYKTISQIEQPLLALARGIDFSVANGEVPSNIQELSSLVKSICRQKKVDHLVLPFIMVLMVSVKNACKLGWFPDADAKEIIDLYQEIGSNFCLPGNMDFEFSKPCPHISTIFERYYPRISLGNIIACLEVKPGCGAYLIDFHISKKAGFSPQEKIRLIVAQTDKLETSACLTSPQQVNFLLNGKGVVGRVNVSMETGPQIPTNVTAMLKFGSNLLQAVGNFSGHYVIAIAFMGMIPLSTPALKDYVQPVIASENSDPEVIVGPSRVSLSCPISYTRIKTPVKGHSCKHVWCFDYDNFIEINSKRPSWRCPHCNQSISFLDIRVDQSMVKVLNEVGENVEDVIISEDGSWKAASKSIGDINSPDYDCQKELETRAVSGSSCGANKVVDLTVEGDVMDMDQMFENEDRKPSSVDLLDAAGSNVNTQTDINNSCQNNLSTVSQFDDDFWSGLDLSGYSLALSSDRYDNRYPSDRYSMYDSVLRNEYRRDGSVPATINRTLPAAQAFAASNGTPNLRPTSATTPTTMFSSGVSSQANASTVFNAGRSTSSTNEAERLRPLHRSRLNLLLLPEMTPLSSRPHSTGQPPYGTQPFSPVPQNAASPSYNQLSGVFQSLHQQQQQCLHIRPPYPQHASQSVGMVQTAAHLSRGQVQSGSVGNVHQQQQALPSRPLFQPVRQPQRQPSPFQNQTPRFGQTTGTSGMSIPQPQGPVQQVSRAENLVNLSADPNLRTAGRMRGSLSGRAREDAINQFMTNTMQPTRVSRPPSDLTSPPPGVTPELHALVTNQLNPNSPAPQT